MLTCKLESCGRDFSCAPTAIAGTATALPRAESYSRDTLNLELARGYLKTLLENKRIGRPESEDAPTDGRDEGGCLTPGTAVAVVVSVLPNGSRGTTTASSP